MDTGNRELHSTATWAATWTGITGLAVVSANMPGWAWNGLLLNSAVILTAAGAVAAYKRSRAAWACFWVIAFATLAIGPFAELAGLVHGNYGVPDVIVVVVEVFAWYWLLRFPRVRPAAVPQSSHVIVHHVMHGALGQAGEAAGQAIRESVPEQVIRNAVPGAVEQPAPRRAIAAAPVRLGRMADALKAYVRR